MKWNLKGIFNAIMNGAQPFYNSEQMMTSLLK